jgi:outer membrane receptor for ferrienterochelin and colicins
MLLVTFGRTAVLIRQASERVAQKAIKTGGPDVKTISAPTPEPTRREQVFHVLIFLACAVMPALLGLTGQKVAAQDQNSSDQSSSEQSKDLGDVSLQELGNIQIYSASKHLQDARDAPSSVTVVTAEQIQEYGYRSLADILESVRGFYITYDRDYSYVGVRGFGRLGDWNSRVLILVDGHRTNNNILGQAMVGTEFLVDIDLIDRVEIIRGPSSSLYGADAFFAVINVITRKAPNLKGVELSFSPGSFGTYQGRATYGGVYRGVDMLFSGTFYDSQGPTLFFPQFNSPVTNNGVTSNTDYEDFQHIESTLSYRGFTLQALFSARDKGAPTGYFGTAFNQPGTRNLDYHQYFDLSYDHSVGEGWQLTARTSYDQARLQAPLEYFTAGPGSATTQQTYSFRGNWWDGDAKLSGTLWEKHRVTVGTEITENLRQDQGNLIQIGNAFSPDPYSSSVWALYAQDEFAVTGKFTVSAGVRYDHYNTFGGTTNPRLGLIYRLFHPTTLKLLYGSAFRAPEPFELRPGFGSAYEDDPGLKPEIIRGLEGVVEQQIGQHVAVSGSVFQNRIFHLISLETDLSNGQFVYLNDGDANAIGVELEADGHLTSGLEAVASYSFTDAEDSATHLTLNNSPRQLGKLNVAVPLLQKKLIAGVDAQYTSPRLTLAGNTVSGYGVVNVTLLGHTLGKHLDLSGSVYNLFDKKYFDPGRPEDVEDSIEQNGRTFRIKLTGRF